MAEMQSMTGPQQDLLIEIVLVPVEDEDDDFETLSIVEDVTANVLAETTTMQSYTSKIENDNRRNAGVILLLGTIAHQAVAEKDLIIAFLQAGTAAIGVLLKQRRVRKIEINLDGDSISIENPDKVTVQTLLDLFEAKHHRVSTQVTSSSKLKIIGKVSKR